MISNKKVNFDADQVESLFILMKEFGFGTTARVVRTFVKCDSCPIAEICDNKNKDKNIVTVEDYRTFKNNCENNWIQLLKRNFKNVKE